jgi:pimeloyl-ACP methyl ester carboxylesterase/DNA-binding SARP family transcriptional activator
VSLAVHLLGELRITRLGAQLPLPPSRKARGLLAYLVLTNRPQRRERLCELLWDLPDDPRGSLRWALSKLRPLVDDETPRIQADRERVQFRRDGVAVDLLDLRDLVLTDTPVDRVRLERAAEALEYPVLEGLDQPQLETFQEWLIAEREEAQRLRLRVLERLVKQNPQDDHAVQRWARSWWRADPLNAGAASALAQSLVRLGRAAEADEVHRTFAETARLAGIDPPPGLGKGPQPPVGQDKTVQRSLLQHQSVAFTTTRDGVRIAYASVGSGPPIVKAANWLNHLELDWGSPIWGKTFQALADRNRLIRYDGRGNGLSDWAVPEINLRVFVDDLESVVDAAGLASFPLLGISQGAAVSIAYAARHPDRVRALILIGGYAAGWRIGASPEEKERREAVMTLTRLGWGTSIPAYRHIFSRTFMPDGTPDDLAWFDEFQRLTTSAENAVRFQDAFGDIDVRHLLLQIRVPTLVLHARDDQRISLAQGRELAAGIPDARFVTLESRNHIILGHEPAWEVCAQEIERFLIGLSAP